MRLVFPVFNTATREREREREGRREGERERDQVMTTFSAQVTKFGIAVKWVGVNLGSPFEQTKKFPRLLACLTGNLHKIEYIVIMIAFTYLPVP